MAYDAGMIAALTFELREKLTGAKIEKIHQPERDQIDLYLRAAGQPRRLTVSACPGSPRMNLSGIPKENPAVPPMFCQMLRKHLAGGIVTGVVQLGFERAVRISFKARDEMGFETGRHLICEMMGKYSNMIFTDEGDKIIGILRPVDFTASEKRQLLAGMTYQLPPLQEGKADPLTEEREAFLEKAKNALDRPADKFIMSSYRGISPLLAREIAFRSSGMTDCSSAAYGEQLYQAFSAVMKLIKEEKFAPVAVQTEGKTVEYTFLPVHHYGNCATLLPFESPSALIDFCFAERERQDRVHRRGQDLYKVLTNAEGRLLRKMEIQKEELQACGEKEKYKQYGDLITANLYALKSGQKEAELVNYYSEQMETISVALDGRLSPAANAQKYYKRYAKAKTAERELSKQLELGEQELKYIRSVTDALDRASLPSDIEEIRGEMVRTGYASRLKTPLSKKMPPMKYLEYRTSGGFRVLCGRNNLQNDNLTFKVADKQDWWFHVHNAPGSHVILITDGVDDPPAIDFTEAATIAACNSKLSDGVSVTVDYTKVRNVKKPPAARPGYVIYHTNYSAVVCPDAELIKRLKTN